MNYAIDGVTYSMSSSENQRVRDRFVQREVIHNAGPMIWFLQEKEHYDEIEDLREKEIWDEAVETYLQELMDEDDENYKDLEFDEQPDFQGRIDEIADEYNLTSPLEETFSAWDVMMELKKDGRLEEFGVDNNLYPEYREPYEFWVVSDWLARLLKEQDEIVAGDVLGFTIWGRCTTGQAISMDSVIGTICYNENLLQGQKYYREDR